eukprot:snap_masked-scaffold_10-processed-gene-2.8-mRNA-1 protein AED:1.00 eAED:1.00 QI:0/0/0/0/1/1/3/0/164
MKKAKSILKIVFLSDIIISLFSIVNRKKASSVFMSALIISCLRASSAILGIQYLASLLIKDIKALSDLVMVSKEKNKLAGKIISIENIRIHVIWFNLYMMSNLMSFLVVWNYSRDKLLMAQYKTKESTIATIIKSGSGMLSKVSFSKKPKEDSNIILPSYAVSL